MNHKTEKAVKCRYYGTRNGCRAGDACPYHHEIASGGHASAINVPGPSVPVLTDGGPPRHIDRSTSARSANSKPNEQTAQWSANPTPMQPFPARTLVSRPVPKAQTDDPRSYQIGQLTSRYSPSIVEGPNGTSLEFLLHPSDPDFPFELRGLQCKLLIPPGYPAQGKPSLRVTNLEMERGYQINVERGFDSLVSDSPQTPLLGLMNALDRNLERFLTAEKAQIIKIVANAGKKVRTAAPEMAPKQVVDQETTPEAELYTPQRIADARAKRESDVRQLEARMGRLPLFSKSPDETSFDLPVQFPHVGRLPLPLQALKVVTLLVPRSYNLDPCAILIKGDKTDESRAVEVAFEKRAREHPNLTLMVHVNYLVQNVHNMAKGRSESTTELRKALKDALPPSDGSTSVENVAIASPVDSERPHIHVIPRPPEWSAPNAHSDDGDDSPESFDSEFETTDGDDDDDDGGTAIPAEAPPQRPERGISISFPHLELYGIELLTLSSLSLTIACDRCKTKIDMKNVHSKTGNSTANTKHISCTKCANPMSVSYRSEMMHSNSIRAGFLDLDGCTTSDMLPSNFTPTCAECSTVYPSPGVISVRGDTAVATCRECHHKMSFQIPELKFLRVSSTGVNRSDRPLPRKKPRENLGIVAGHELPKRGRCQHYSKSYRWFRFSCCAKVYPCDRCHDAAEEHANEHANRMICGFCSREQTYRPEDCAHCHSGLTGKRSGGFWEGGKGTRDKNKMSRKDPRKYKRRGGGSVGGAAVGGNASKMK